MSWGNTSLTSTIRSNSRNTVTYYYLSHYTTSHFIFVILHLLLGSYQYLIRFSRPRHCPAHRCEESIQIFAIHILCGKPMSSESLAWSLRDRWLLSSPSISENECRIRLSFQHLQLLHGNIGQNTVVFCICLQSVHIIVMCWGPEKRTAPKTPSNQPQRETCLRQILSCRTKDVPQWLCHCRRSRCKLTKLLPSLLSKRIDEPRCN